MIPVKYLFDITKQGLIFIESRSYMDNDKWVICCDGMILNQDLEWEYEPQPSSRTDEFIKNTRFTLERAKELVNKYIKK